MYPSGVVIVKVIVYVPGLAYAWAALKPTRLLYADPGSPKFQVIPLFSTVPSPNVEFNAFTFTDSSGRTVDELVTVITAPGVAGLLGSLGVDDDPLPVLEEPLPLLDEPAA